MKVAYLISQYPAASHTFIRREVKAMRAAGVDVRTYSIRRPDANERAAPDAVSAYEETFYILPARPLDVLRCHLQAILRDPVAYGRGLVSSLRHRVPGCRGALNALFYFAEAVVLANRLRQDGVNHLHNHFANAAANVGRLAARELGIPWSLTLHGISETDYPAGLMLAEKIQDARFVACVSYFGMAQAMRISSHRHWAKMAVVRCGLQLDALPHRPARTADAGLVRIICVGRLSAEKGHLGLVEVFARLRLEGLPVELVLIGDGPASETIRQRVAEQGLTQQVRFLGRCAEEATLEAIADADILVLPSFMEGLPVVLMEAMAIGVPVVGPRVAGVPELITDGVEGLLFTPGHWNDLHRQLHRLLVDPALRRQLATQGRQKVETEFQIQQSAGRMVQLLSTASLAP